MAGTFDVKPGGRLAISRVASLACPSFVKSNSTRKSCSGRMELLPVKGLASAPNRKPLICARTGTLICSGIAWPFSKSVAWIWTAV